MEFNQIATIVAIGFSVLSSGFTIAMACVIKFNDMAHQGKALEEMKESNKTMAKDLTEVLERISKIEGICATKGSKECK